MRTLSYPRRPLGRLLGAACLVLSAAFSLPLPSADGAAFFQADPFTSPATNPEDPQNIAGYYFGDPTVGNVARWTQEEITYNFSPNFTAYYGAAGQTAVIAAFATWEASLAIDTLPGEHRVTDVGGGNLQPNDPRIKGAPQFDIRSIALHEIGHVLGLHHPDQAQGNPWNRNYNVNGMGNWEQGTLPNGSEPIMWHTSAPNKRTWSLTNDDIYAIQYLYGRSSADPLDGPVLAGAVALSFALAENPDILIDVAQITPTLGLGWTNGTIEDGESWRTLTKGHIWFSIPEPSSFVLLALGCVAMLVWRKRLQGR